jgi:hypothetical protein
MKTLPRFRWNARVLGLASVFAAAFGCGLVSSDITKIGFDLPARHYMFDTARFGLPAAVLPSVPCTADGECCTAAGLLGYDCATNPPLVCDSGACAAIVTVETPPTTINLKQEVPSLSGLNSQSLVDVSINRISYDVVSTMNVDLPAVELYLAPDGATSTSDPGAAKFGTVPVTPAGATITDGQVVLEAAAESTFSGYAHNFGTPFTFLAKTTVIVRGGEPIPAGKVDITVQGRLAAKPSL